MHYVIKVFFVFFETPILTLCLLAHRNTRCGNACLSGSKWIQSVELDIVNGSFAIYVRWFLGWRYILRYTVLMSPNKDETTVHCCDPALSVVVMFGVSKGLSRSISLGVCCFYIFVFWLIKSLVDLKRFFVCGPLQFFVSHI